MTIHYDTTANAQDVTATHTPGPWRQEAGTNLVWGACNPDDTTSYGMGVPVAETRIEFNRTYDWDQALANARLIAAAPDLLRSLESFVAEYVALVESGDAGFWDAETETKVIDARAAIAKATGA